MEKRIFYLTIMVLFFGITHSQTIKDNENIDSTSIVIKGDDLKNFTSNNIVELLNGLFVSAFKTVPNVNDYLFIVDGFVLNDINSLTLNDIEEIRFSYNQEGAEATPFFRTSVFFIKTKKNTSTKNGKWNINSRIGINFKDNRNLIDNTSSSGFAKEERTASAQNGFLNFNHISYQLKNEKIAFYLSGRYNLQTFPKQNEHVVRTDNQVSETINISNSGKENNSSFLGFIEYKPSKNLNFDFNVNYSKLKQHIFLYDDYSFKINSNNSQSINNKTINYDLNVLNVSFRNKVNFLKYFNNEFKFEFVKNEYSFVSNLDEKKIYNGVLSNFFSTVTDVNKNSKLNGTLLLSNHLKVHFNTFKKIRTELTFKASVYNPNNSFESISKKYSPVSVTPNYSTINSKNDIQINSFNPSIKLNYSNILEAKIGLDYISSTSMNPFTGRYKWNQENSFYSSTINLFKIFNRKTKNDFFNFNLSYFNFLNNSTKYQFLTSAYNNEEPVESYLNEEQHPWHSTDTQDLDWKVLRNKVLSFQLNRTFFHKKLVVNAFISNEKIKKLRLLRYRIYLPPSNYISILDYGEETQKKIGIQFSGQIFETKTTNYSTVFNILFPKAEYDEITKADSLNAYQSTARLGWYNNFRFKKFYFQVKSLLELNHQYYEFNTSTSVFEMNKANDFIISNVAVGYNFKENKKGQMIKNISLSISANNILQSQSISNKYSFPKYAGIGASFNF